MEMMKLITTIKPMIIKIVRNISLHSLFYRGYSTFPYISSIETLLSLIPSFSSCFFTCTFR